MGRFYDLFYKRGDISTAYEQRDGRLVSISMPGSFGGPAGYGALMSVDFAACVQTKARSMASLPFVVVQERRDGRRNLDSHPLAPLLNGMANEEMTVSALMDWTVLRRDTFGNAYWFVEWSKGKPVAIWPITGQVTHDFDMSKPAGYRTTYTVSPGDEHVPAGTYFSNEVVNIHTHVTKDGIKGVSLARIAAEQIGLSVDLERFYRSMLHNGNHQLGHVEVPEGRMSPDDLNALRNAVDAKAGIVEAGHAPIFGYGAKWVNDQQTMQDASVIEQQKWVLQQVCRACNVPPWKVYDGESATYNGGQQMRIDYVTDTIVPDVRQIEMALQPVLDACYQSGCRAKFKINGLMRGDDSSRTQYYRELAYLGALTREDVRDLEDLEPVEGIGKPLFPLNYGTVNEDGTVNVFNSDSPEPGDGSQTGVTNNVQGQE
jgi:HK97 family phage portal protein